jgi:HD superfamily phosphohydrolase
MAKHIHEIRDPIHVFVRLSSDERRVLGSRPFQRLRDVHQLALTYLVYPGATHRRFEHSLGVMELAGRVYEVVTHYATDDVRSQFPDMSDDLKREYWRRVLRMAALCHDVGHLPFSHAAEKELLPVGWTHETLTAILIRSHDMQSIWKAMKIDPEDVVKLALGPKELPDVEFTAWETILSEIIVGDAFGVDRMDYLLRDSHHAGVAYGRFDHFRLIDTLRILPVPSSGDNDGEDQYALGVEEGGVQSAEALMIARYFMYSQVYFHPVRRIYDVHLKDFLKEWLPNRVYPTDAEGHLNITDAEVTAAMRAADRNTDDANHTLARRVIRREHFKRIYSRNPADAKINPKAGQAICQALSEKFEATSFRHDSYAQRGGPPSFPVRLGDNRIALSLAVSEALSKLPAINVDYVFADRAIEKDASRWLQENLIEIIQPKGEENDG